MFSLKCIEKSNLSDLLSLLFLSAVGPEQIDLDPILNPNCAPSRVYLLFELDSKLVLRFEAKYRAICAYERYVVRLSILLRLVVPSDQILLLNQNRKSSLKRP